MLNSNRSGFFQLHALSSQDSLSTGLLQSVLSLQVSVAMLYYSIVMVSTLMSKFAIMIPIPVGIVLCVPWYAVPIVQILHVHSVSLLHFGQSFYQDFPLDCPLCRLHVPVPTIHPLPLIHGIVPWTVFCVPCMFLSQLSIPFP